jgi:eukaryotic-like serine/threonine-protein kinase
VRIVGRYALYGKLATGGMATVHFGRLLGPVGFSRTVAIKRLHPQFAKDPEFVAMFLDEARLAARIQHPNVVATLDVVALSEELLLIMDYIRGEAFSRLMRGARKKSIEPPLSFTATIVTGMLHGLHAAHETTDERGQPLKVVHRDVSPQNILVGVDGVPRLLDFGVAKAGARVQVTRDGQVKGKLSYMSPEQLTGKPVDRRADLFAAGAVLWEALTGKRLFLAEDTQEIIRRIVELPVPPPSALNPAVPPAFDKIVARALEKDPDARYSTAREFAVALEHGVGQMSAREVGEWVEEIAGDVLEMREQALAELESFSSVTELSPPTAPEGVDIATLLRGASGSSIPPRAPVRKKPALPSPADDMPTTVFDSPNRTQPALRVSSLVPPVIVASNSPDPDLDADPFNQRGNKKVVALVLALGAALVLVTLLWSLGGPTDEPRAVATMPQVVNAAQVATSHAREGVAAPSASAVSPSSDVNSAPTTGNAKVKNPAAPALPKPAPAARPSRPWTATPKPPPAAADVCKQPFTVDSDGIRRIKSQCI